MARNKNALRLHEIAPYKNEEEAPQEGWLALAKWITNVTDDSEDNTDPYADYAGDGTVSDDVIGVTRAYTFEGTYDEEDAAQALVKKMRNEIGEGRKVWLRVTDSNKKSVESGVATVTDIVAGSGEASDYEEFSCKITYNVKPTETPIG